MLVISFKSSLLRSTRHLHHLSRQLKVGRLAGAANYGKPITRHLCVSMGSMMSDSSSSAFHEPHTAKVKFSEQELRSRLTPMQYHVTQEKGTERAFTGELNFNKETGVYNCVVCGENLFKSDSKYDSGSGWPSFYEVMNSDAVEKHTDISHGMKRVEVTCKKCGSHLGHVFDDGPNPTGQRYCINSASLKFDADKKSEL